MSDSGDTVETIGTHEVLVARVASCPSTQDLARTLLAEHVGRHDRIVVIAGEQTAGRGREGRSWVSEAGLGVYLSVAIRGPIGTAGASEWPEAVTKQCAAALATLAGVPVVRRAPNDLYIDRRKVGGVLIDSVSQGSAFARVIVGIGVNLHGDARDIDGRAVTSLEAAQLTAGVVRGVPPRDDVARALSGAVLAIID